MNHNSSTISRDCGTRFAIHISEAAIGLARQRDFPDNEGNGTKEHHRAAMSPNSVQEQPARAESPYRQIVRRSWLDFGDTLIRAGTAPTTLLPNRSQKWVLPWGHADLLCCEGQNSTRSSCRWTPCQRGRWRCWLDNVHVQNRRHAGLNWKQQC